MRLEKALENLEIAFNRKSSLLRNHYKYDSEKTKETQLAYIDLCELVLSARDRFEWFDLGDWGSIRDVLPFEDCFKVVDNEESIPFPKIAVTFSADIVSEGRVEKKNFILFCFDHTVDDDSQGASIFVAIFEITSKNQLAPVDFMMRLLKKEEDGSLEWTLSKNFTTNDGEYSPIAICGAQCVLYLLKILQCNNIYIHKEEVPEKLKKKRRKTGKHEGYTKHTLRIRTDPKEINKDYLGGTHASPRLHMRRGHIRHCASGVTTWVQPCMVGKAHGVVEKDYAVNV